VTVPVGDQDVTLSISASNTCLATTARLRVTLNAKRIAASRAGKLRFVKAEFSIDRGVRHTRHRTVRRHGRATTITSVTYLPNRTVVSLPAKLSFRLARLRPGAHALRIRLFFHTSVHGHVRTVTRTLTRSFKVCRGAAG
jgi:hypothetical protein